MPSLQEIDLESSLSDIKKRKELNPRIFRTIIKTANKIRGQTIIHLNATYRGGGVAELLRSQIPFENVLSLKSRWLVIEAPRRFFEITKKIHNLLQGKSGFLTEKEREYYLSVNRSLGKSLTRYCERFESGIILVHDPQPLPLIQFVPPGFFPMFRLHIDISTPHPATLEFLRPFMAQYKCVVLSNENYRFSVPWLEPSKVKVIMPAIDPFSPKNMPMGLFSAKSILEKFGINSSKPIITQVSRFDPWKDPLGVIKAYYLAKNKIPELQLVLAGLMTAKDDPEAKEVFEKVIKHAKGDPDIFSFSNPGELKDVSNDTFINALYTASDIIIQKSIREGFGMTITEAMWKGKAVIAGKTTGAMLQIKNGRNGILVKSPEETAKAVVRLLKNEKLRNRLGRKARQSVKKKFLFLRAALDHFKVYESAYKVGKI